MNWFLVLLLAFAVVVSAYSYVLGREILALVRLARERSEAVHYRAVLKRWEAAEVMARQRRTAMRRLDRLQPRNRAAVAILEELERWEG
jgi:hypothetical protein